MSDSEIARSTVYVDTSALGRVILEEPDRESIENALEGFEVRVASRLLGIELRRLARRERAIEEAEQMLENMVLIPIDDEVLAATESILPANVGTLDAIHLATALRLAAAGHLDAMITYDKRLAAAAREHGIEVIAPT